MIVLRRCFGKVGANNVYFFRCFGYYEVILGVFVGVAYRYTCFLDEGGFFWGQFERRDGVLLFWSENLTYMREHAGRVVFGDIFHFVYPVLIYRVCKFLFRLRFYFV